MTAPHGMHKQLDWKAGVWAGVITGSVFMMVEMLMVWLIPVDSTEGN
ncbi:MAG TPA: hypothetical protein VJ577_07125 [Burkholderiaceae bacterium]|nr:hypothetical protein [Burkholderiaceae bacterium]